MERPEGIKDMVADIKIMLIKMSQRFDVQLSEKYYEQLRFHEELLSLQQRSSVDEYWQKFQVLAASTFDLTDDRLQEIFINGLRDDIKLEVRSFKCRDLIQAMELAQKIEDRNRIPDRFRSQQSPKPTLTWEQLREQLKARKAERQPQEENQLLEPKVKEVQNKVRVADGEIIQSLKTLESRVENEISDEVIVKNIETEIDNSDEENLSDVLSKNELKKAKELKKTKCSMLSINFSEEDYEKDAMEERNVGEKRLKKKKSLVYLEWIGPIEQRSINKARKGPNLAKPWGNQMNVRSGPRRIRDKKGGLGFDTGWATKKPPDPTCIKLPNSSRNSAKKVAILLRSPTSTASVHGSAGVPTISAGISANLTRLTQSQLRKNELLPASLLKTSTSMTTSTTIVPVDSAMFSKSQISSRAHFSPRAETIIDFVTQAGTLFSSIGSALLEISACASGARLVRIWGLSLDSIDATEDRKGFNAILNDLAVQYILLDFLRSVTSYLALGVIINVGEVRFLLHKFPQFSESNHLHKLVIKASEDKSEEINIVNFPGGPKALKKLAKLCYEMEALSLPYTNQCQSVIGRELGYVLVNMNQMGLKEGSMSRQSLLDYARFYMVDFPQLGNCVKIGIPLLLWVIRLYQYLKHVSLLRDLPIFERTPELSCVTIIWIYSVIFTARETYRGQPTTTQVSCRTNRANLISTASWIKFPYPLQRRPPTILAGNSFAMMTAVLVSMVKSIETYKTASQLAIAAPSSAYVLSRDNGWQGIGVTLDGIFGMGTGSICSCRKCGTPWTDSRGESSSCLNIYWLRDILFYPRRIGSCVFLCQVVQEALNRIMPNGTIVVVAYHLSTVRNADMIAVIHRGKMVEKGKTASKSDADTAEVVEDGEMNLKLEASEMNFKEEMKFALHMKKRDDISDFAKFKTKVEQQQPQHHLVRRVKMKEPKVALYEHCLKFPP